GKQPCGLDDAVRHVVAARDAAEDVEEDRAHAGVGGDDPERGHDLLGIRAAADVEKVGRLTAVVLDQVHRRHREPRAVDAAADGAVQLDEGQAGLAGRELRRRLSLRIAQRGSTASRWIWVGVSAATASMSTPPAALTIRTGRCDPRSTIMPT